MDRLPEQHTQQERRIRADALTQARRPIVELLVLAAPAVAQMASYTVMQFIDTLLLTRIGDTEATAGGNGGMIAFAAISVGYGTLLLVNTLASQNFGQKNYQACGRYAWQGVWFSLLFSLLLLPIIPLSRPMFGMFGHEPLLARLETVYVAIVMTWVAIKLGGVALGQFLLAIDRPGSVLISTLVGVGVNALAAWILVLGHWGSPQLGVVGSAWAQNIGVSFETLTLVAICMAPKIRATFGLRQWSLRWKQFWLLVRVGIPSGVQMVCDVLAWSLFVMWVMAPFGTAGMAANTYTFRYMSVSFMPAVGVGMAVTALVGRSIGAGRTDLAEQRTQLGFRVTIIYMVACGLLFIFGRNLLMGLFTKDPRVLKMGATLLMFAGVYQVFDAMYIIYCGGLRGAGDTFVPAVATAVLNWGISVLGGYAIARKLPGLGVAGPWTAATTYGMCLGVFLLIRFKRGRWKLIRLERHSPPMPDSDTVPNQSPPLGGEDVR